MIYTAVFCSLFVCLYVFAVQLRHVLSTLLSHNALSPSHLDALWAATEKEDQIQVVSHSTSLVHFKSRVSFVTQCVGRLDSFFLQPSVHGSCFRVSQFSLTIIDFACTEVKPLSLMLVIGVISCAPV